LCIEGYPDRNTPTVLIYKDGDIRRQIVTLGELGGVRTNSKGTSAHSCVTSASFARSFVLTSTDLEKLLIDLGAVQRNDQRLQKTRAEDEDAPKSTIRQGKPTVNDDDSDWD
jgi:hypothetical protein